MTNYINQLTKHNSKTSTVFNNLLKSRNVLKNLYQANVKYEEKRKRVQHFTYLAFIRKTSFYRSIFGFFAFFFIALGAGFFFLGNNPTGVFTYDQTVYIKTFIYLACAGLAFLSIFFRNFLSVEKEFVDHYTTKAKKQIENHFTYLKTAEYIDKEQLHFHYSESFDNIHDLRKETVMILSHINNDKNLDEESKAELWDDVLQNMHYKIQKITNRFENLTF